MQADLPERTQALYDRLKEFPEAYHRGDMMTLKPDPSAAFFELRQLLEREVIPALEELARMKAEM